MKTIRYNLTFLGTIEVPDNATYEEILRDIEIDYSYFADFAYVNNIDWNEE